MFKTEVFVKSEFCRCTGVGDGCGDCNCACAILADGQSQGLDVVREQGVDNGHEIFGNQTNNLGKGEAKADQTDKIHCTVDETCATDVLAERGKNHVESACIEGIACRRRIFGFIQSNEIIVTAIQIVFFESFVCACKNFGFEVVFFKSAACRFVRCVCSRHIRLRLIICFENVECNVYIEDIAVCEESVLVVECGTVYAVNLFGHIVFVNCDELVRIVPNVVCISYGAFEAAVRSRDDLFPDRRIEIMLDGRFFAVQVGEGEFVKPESLVNFRH